MRARWGESCVLITYPSGRDVTTLPARDFPRWSRKEEVLSLAIYWIPYWPSLFGQDGWIMSKFFLAFLLTSVHWKLKKKRLGQYTATVTSRLINNAYIGLCRGFRKPWALESGIQLKESRIRLTIGIQNPSSTDKTNRTDRSTHYQLCGMASRIRNQSTAWTRHNSRLSWISLHGAT